MRSDRTDASRNALATGAGVLVIPDDAMVIVPVRNVLLFPGMILPLTISREQSMLAAQQAVKTERPVGISCSVMPRSKCRDRMIFVWSVRWPTSCAT
jgi:ATP-dependent Lon protease